MSATTLVAAEAATSNEASRKGRHPAVEIVGTAVLALTMVLVVQVFFTHTMGTSSEVTLAGRGTGVHRVAIAERIGLQSLLRQSADVHASTSDGPLTEWQKASSEAGWVAACESLESLAVLTEDQTAGCLTRQPVPSYGEAHVGGSSGLAEALGSVTAITDVTGDLTVAATGQVGIVEPGSAGAEFNNTTGWVYAIGDAPEKFAAALNIGADIMFVPTDNRTEFDAEAAGTDVEVIGVSTVAEAIIELCARSGTSACDRVLAHVGRA